MIQGVKVKELKLNCDERGMLFEVLRSDEELFQQFGQAYITSSFPGVVKAWHMHKLQTDNLCLIKGCVKFVLYDARDGSSTHGEINEIFPRDDRRLLIQIPPGIYHGFKNIGHDDALVLNIPTHVYQYDKPDEYRLDPHQSRIPYDWSRKDG